MKTVLITIPWFHPAYKAGGPVQSIANMVNQFSTGIEYFIVCGNTDLNDTPIEKLETGKWVVYNANTKVWYAEQNKRSDTLVKITEKLKPDIIYINGMFSWHFTIVPLLFCKAKYKLISPRGMLHPGALSQKRGKKKLFLSLWKFFDLHKKATFHATDNEEKIFIEKNFGDEINTMVAGNFPRIFSFGSSAKKKGVLKLVSIAVISPMKNHLLVLDALLNIPAIVEYHICGPIKDMEYWQKCLAKMKEMPVNISVIFHGEVPPSGIEEVLNKGHVFILPSKSESFGHAIFEALSSGKPVIISHTTPWQQLKEKKAGINVNLNINSIADSIAFFADMVQEEYSEWSHSACDYSKKAIDFDILKDQYANLFTLPVLEK
ncbi:MAG: glycosyltransferase [Ferruginibacter sp.]